MSCNSFAGCSFLGVGMKFNPFDNSDISPGVSLYLLRLVIWVMVLLNLLWCFVSGVGWLCTYTWGGLILRPGGIKDSVPDMIEIEHTNIPVKSGLFTLMQMASFMVLVRPLSSLPRMLKLSSAEL